jgi:hypothetical protein
VRPRNEVALSNVLKMVERPHSKGGVASTRIPRFHFFWYPDHFEYKPRIFKCKYARLSSREKIDHDRIHEFVRSFQPADVVDEEGNRQLDSCRNSVTVPHVIDTQSLVLSLSTMEILGR